MSNLVRIVIVADNPLTRMGLATILENQTDCTVLGQVDTSMLNQLEAFNPDVLIWDVGWGETITEVDYPVAALISDENQAQEVWRTGVKGIFRRTIDPTTLVAGLKAVAQELVAFESELANAILPTQTPPDDLSDSLTPRELEVLRLLAEGLSNKAIAVALGISDHTVKFHVNAIMTKLSAQSRTEAAVRGARLGLIAL